MDDYGIYNIDFGQVRGHEQGSQRPAIVFKTINEVKLCIVVPLTSNLEHLNLPYTVPINSTSSTNLKQNSVALIFQIRAVDSNVISINKIGTIEEYQIKKIKNAIKDMLSLI